MSVRPFHQGPLYNLTVREFSKQNQDLLRQALEEAQADLLKKFEIIREARTRPRNLPPCNRGTHLDETQVNQETVQWSLALQREQQQKEQQELLERVRFLRKEKQQKEQRLQEAMETIELHRRVSARAAAVRSANVKAKTYVRALALCWPSTHNTGKKRKRNASWLYGREPKRMKPIWPCGKSWKRTGKNEKDWSRVKPRRPRTQASPLLSRSPLDKYEILSKRLLSGTAGVLPDFSLFFLPETCEPEILGRNGEEARGLHRETWKASIVQSLNQPRCRKALYRCSEVMCSRLKELIKLRFKEQKNYLCQKSAQQMSTGS